MIVKLLTHGTIIQVNQKKSFCHLTKTKQPPFTFECFERIFIDEMKHIFKSDNRDVQ